MIFGLLKKKSERITASRVVTTSFVVDILDVIFNLIVAIITGSAVMISQTLQGVADLAASALLIVGVSRSRRQADNIYPFGYGRELYFWTLLSAFVSLIVTSGMSIYLGWQRFLNPQQIQDLPLAYLVLGLSVLTNGYSASLSARRLLGGASSNIISAFSRSSLIETKSTLVLDLMGTTASVLGLVALIIYGLSGDLRWDGLGAMVVGASLGAMVLLLIQAVRGLIIGPGASVELSQKITQIALSFPEVESVTGLKTLHLAAENLLVNLDLQVRDNLSTVDIEKLVEAIKGKISSQIPEATEIQIELKTQ